ncbi:MAG: restriction endonuclease [Phycisphaerales bacterium]|nr:restriction endonuclease [Phycisphaerales bacterium]
MAKSNLLLFGDNLPFLTDPDVFASESVDLVYLDPPFNSNANYNVLFKETTGQLSSAQIRAFDDTWSWDDAANGALHRLMHERHAPDRLKSLVKTFHSFLGHSPMLAYLVQMAVRLVHLRRVLKPSGSLYLHCDPTASHYLKLVLDGIFGPERFLNEIVWKRTSGRKGPTRFGRVHDVILFYSPGEGATWNPPSLPLTQESMRGHDFVKEGGKVYRVSDLSAMGGGPERRFGKSAIAPPAGRHWQYDQQGVDERWRDGRIRLNSKGVPRLYTPIEDLPGVAVHDVWTDIEPINAAAQERLHYPTQKPLALLKRIIAASSNPGDVVLDPFCGCGTTIDAVESLNRESPGQPPRRWIGIDVTHLAVNLIKSRLTRFDPPPLYNVRGEPVDIDGASALFKQNPYQFQFWACGLVGARPYGSMDGRPGKKGADRGIDGVRYFVDDATGPKTILVQVKGGKSGAKDVRDFRGTIEREGAALGIFIAAAAPTKEMVKEAATAAPYKSSSERSGIPRIQIVTIEKLLSGGTPTQPQGITLPRGLDLASDKTFKKAQRHDDGGLFAWGAQ